MSNCCDIWDVFDEKNNLIKVYKHWKLLIRNRNTTLGNCVAVTKQHHEALSELPAEEVAEFSIVAKDSERALKKAFSYDKINYLMLMMKDKHTHFHVIPRYRSERMFAGMVFVDENWPKVAINNKEPLSSEILNKMKTEIKKHL